MKRIILLALLILDLLCMLVFTVFAWQIRDAALTEVSVGAVRSGTIDGTFCRITIPSEAILRDETGTYFYALVTKETSIGTRYYAERIDTVILAEDAEAGITALSAPVTSGDPVILSSEKELHSGMQVRVPEQAAERERGGR